MKVYKFGGASVKNVQNIRTVADIIKSEPDQLVVVVSAMGSTTDDLEKIFSFAQRKVNYSEYVAALRDYHEKIMNVLFKPSKTLRSVGTQTVEDRTMILDGTLTVDVNEIKEAPLHQERGWGEAVYHAVNLFFHDLTEILQSHHDPRIKYDQVVSFGELISSMILYQYLAQEGINIKWLDVRNIIATDDTYGEAKVDWTKTRQQSGAMKESFDSCDVIITQGFIGKSPQGLTTTLGREGSDFTAAILSACLHAESLTVWKDVPGLMNADPKRLPDARVLKELPYSEAAEMMYYGANLIHTKTIRPLANQNIPLYVKSFIDPSLPGSKIHHCHIDKLPVMYVFKDDQCLVSCKVTDYTFITELHLQDIFTTLNNSGIRLNMIQHSAISMSFCFDYNVDKLRTVLERLSPTFEVYYNLNLTLITIKNYTPEVFASYISKKGILLEQSSRSTLQLLMKMV